MTCIAAVIEKGKIYMGADSAGVSSDHSYSVRTDPKIFIKENFIFGFTSSFRMGQLLHYKWQIPTIPENMAESKYLHTLFIDSIMRCFEDNHFSKEIDNNQIGGTFLFGRKGKLYKVWADFQIEQTGYNFASCGCGENWANAILHYTQNKRIPPKKRLIQSLETAEFFSGAVKRPFHILSI